jgi:hypothetical protein
MIMIIILIMITILILIMLLIKRTLSLLVFIGFWHQTCATGAVDF